MSLNKFFVLLTLLPLSFQSLANDKSEQTSKVEVLNADGLKTPQRLQSIKELWQALGYTDPSESKACVVALEQAKPSQSLTVEQQQLINQYINSDETKLDMMLKLMAGLKSNELEYFLNQVLPYLKNFRTDLLTDIFFSVEENPTLFFTHTSNLYSRIKAGKATQQDIELLNSGRIIEPLTEKRTLN